MIATLDRHKETDKQGRSLLGLCRGDMWGKCPCTDCGVQKLNYSNKTGGNMGSFPVIHGFISLSPSSSMGSTKYQDPVVGLRRSATCGYLPHHNFAPVKGDWSEKSHPHLINGRLPIMNGKAEYTDDDDTLKAKLTIHNMGVRGDISPPEEVGKKTRDYSDDSLTPDSSLPAVIRRRNRNRRKKLAVSNKPAVSISYIVQFFIPSSPFVITVCMYKNSLIALDDLSRVRDIFINSYQSNTRIIIITEYLYPFHFLLCPTGWKDTPHPKMCLMIN